MAIESLFVAAFPDPDCQESLDGVVRDLAAALPDLRMVNAARRHMTILFLGRHDGPDRRCMDAAAQTLDSLQAGMPSVHLDRVVSLGHPQRPAVAVAAAKTPEELAEIREQLLSTLQPCCSRTDRDSAFKPHITLGYARRPLRPRIEIADFVLQPSALCLVRSIQGEAAYRMVTSTRKRP